LGLFFAAYNWCKVHRSLRGKTPAMATGLTDHVWTIREFLANALHTLYITTPKGVVVN
jgi:hypothetical protein